MTGHRNTWGAVPLLLAVGASAAAAPPTIKIDVVAGRACARCTISGAAVSIPGNVVIDLGQRVPLLVHERTARLLGLGRRGKVTLKFSGVTLAGLPAVSQGLYSLEGLTRNYAAELGEIPVVAILGLPAFTHHIPQLEIAAKELRLLAKGGAEEDGLALGAAWGDVISEGAVVVAYEEEGNGYWLKGVGPEEFPLRVRFSTAQLDTIIDATAADMLGAPGGDVDSLLVGSLDVSRYVALRPEDLSSSSPPRPDVILGTNLLTSFRLTVDTENRRMMFEPIAAPRFPQEERAYYMARAEEDADAIEAFLKEHRSSRLAPEAADALLAHRLDEYPPRREAIVRVMRLQAEAASPERRAQKMVLVADELLAVSRDDGDDLAWEALHIGLAHAADDLNARAAHEIHARLGRVCLRRGDLRQARRHLLSAAFGMPRDPLVNVWLGELYERSGKPARAWSRYVQAVLADDAPPEALKGLDRLNRDASFRATFTMADAEQLLEGRTLEYHSPHRHADDNVAGDFAPVGLVELFTCVDHPETQAAELAFGGLGEYFEDAEVAFVAYHLPVPQADPLATPLSTARAAYYEVGAVPVARFDGGDTIAGGGGEGAVQETFAAYLSAARTAPSPQKEWRLGGHLAFVSEELSGEVVLSGPPAGAELRLIVLLCEKRVLVRGANGLLLHRHVARGVLSPVEGYIVPPAAGRRVFPVRANPVEIGAALESTIAMMEEKEGIEFVMRPTYIDPRGSVIVAFLQNHGTKQVLAACVVEIPTGGDDRR